METLAHFSTKLPILVAAPRPAPADLFNRRRPAASPILAVPSSMGARGGRSRSLVVSASTESTGSSAPRRTYNSALKKSEKQNFASVSSSSVSGIAATSGSQQVPLPPPQSSIGSPLFWIGVGVGISAIFSTVAKKIKERATQQLFQSMMSQQAFQNEQFTNSAFSPNSPFPFGATFPSSQAASTRLPVDSQPLAASKPLTVDVPSTEVEATSSGEARDEASVPEQKKYTFVDISPEDVPNKNSQYSPGPSKARSEKEASPNGTTVNQERVFNQQSKSSGPQPGLSVEALEKMMEDPTVQKMVYPYLPEEMRNPTSFKWMLQNPQYRKQLEDMLNDMGGSSEWDDRMMESLKNFDLSSPEVKQQFDQIGLTPEEVISKIMENPDVAMAFQNPKVQAAIMDCSQSPLSITKYQSDPEVMEVFQKISELFPGISS